MTDLVKTIEDLIERLDGDFDAFADTLQAEQIPHLSFSQITTVEACPYRYYLQYVLRQEPVPLPDYFTKGKLFHQIVASFYKTEAGSREDIQTQAFQAIADGNLGETRRQLENAFLVHLDHCWRDYEVVSVEKPFVMAIDPDLPPCVGVIDLVLRKGNTYILVDHKTGRDFYPQDELQMAIYVEYMRRMFGGAAYEFYYDQYRWVNNLSRIRKPAFQRSGVRISANDWGSALARIQKAYRLIVRIRETNRAACNGECFRCPYRGNCRS